jgi:glycosyltransferase involved in cell wall biosynthesis
MSKSLHLLLATVEDPADPASWSGTPFHMRVALERQFEQVTVLSSPQPERHAGDAATRLLLGRSRYPLWMTRTALKAYARRLDHAIAQARPDAVLCISSQHLIYAKTHALPLFMVSDAPWMAYKEAYKAFDPLPLMARSYAALEARAARNTTGVVYPTPWACQEATARFGLDSGRVHCIALGANRFCASSDMQVFARIRQKPAGPWRFLFVGKDWQRKGGPLALHIVRQLNQQGLPSTLVVIGCTPEIETCDQAHVQVMGFMSPTNTADQQQMQGAFEEAHFFLVPSHAECYGLVFAEAQSYGLPCISLNSQGIPGVVEHGVSGLLFDATDTVADMVNPVLALAHNRKAYDAMATAARMKYSSQLNWDAFGQRIHHLVAQACESETTAHA